MRRAPFHLRSPSIECGADVFLSFYWYLSAFHPIVQTLLFAPSLLNSIFLVPQLEEKNVCTL